MHRRRVRFQLAGQYFGEGGDPGLRHRIAAERWHRWGTRIDGPTRLASGTPDPWWPGGTRVDADHDEPDFNMAASRASATASRSSSKGSAAGPNGGGSDIPSVQSGDRRCGAPSPANCGVRLSGSSLGGSDVRKLLERNQQQKYVLRLTAAQLVTTLQSAGDRVCQRQSPDEAAR